jgi:anaerobic magnesium-protoporphyrin IX monomethyl ester cyclase
VTESDNNAVDALLVGYENQENIGLRSIVAYLQARGRRPKLIPFFPCHHSQVLEAAQRYRPRIIGFSLIFQHTLDEFGDLMRRLRSSGVTAHFTAGGHYPSLRPEQALDLLPELDSIVRFEGELTLADLIENLDSPERWESIPGLAFRRDSKTVLNPPRPLIGSLDSLPFIYRDEPRSLGNGLRIASMLASRGCLLDCSFCSIRQFYGGAGGALRRVRSPQAVVDEMRALFIEKGVRCFLFQDDDFAVRSQRQHDWLRAFLQALARAGLPERVRWKISCRVDDLEPETLKAMLDHGLMAVYLGVESGSELGLRTLNKRVSAAQNLAAIDLLKRYDVAMSIGFMLFDPSSTMSTIRENVDFLRAVGEDGYFPISFCKMLPYAGTPIEAELRRSGRLEGTATRPDYRFLDPRLDWYEFLVKRIFTRRNFSPDGIVSLLQDADFDYRLAKAFGLQEQRSDREVVLRRLIRQGNMLALQTLERLRDEIISHGPEYLLEEQETIIGLAEHEWQGEMMIEAELRTIENMARSPRISRYDEKDIG